MLGGIEIHDIEITQFMALFSRKQAGRIVAADLHIACSTWSSAVLFTIDSDTDRLDTALEIGAHRRAVNDQQGFLGRFNTQSDRRSEHHRTQIERSARSVRRDETLVAFDDFDARIDDHFDRRHRQTKTLGRRLETPRIVGDAEKTDLSVNAPEGFQTFEEFDTVVQARSRHVHLDILVLRNLHRAPFAIGVRVADIPIGFAIIKTQGAPICCFHIKSVLKNSKIHTIHFSPIRRQPRCWSVRRVVANAIFPTHLRPSGSYRWRVCPSIRAERGSPIRGPVCRRALRA